MKKEDKAELFLKLLSEKLKDNPSPIKNQSLDSLRDFYFEIFMEMELIEALQIATK